ncbi:MAG TPA: hypothetical protein VFQ61_05690 [Polyangiaceae bacterium]|nr:hypothetical protein [Polyangiaceae bacterium]
MTLPRQILPGRTYFVTRRCTQRMFLLRPSRATNLLISYCLALAAYKTGVLLHAVCFMSNHWHGVLSDPFARLPEFLERFHRLFAKAQNAALGRRENLWSSDKPSVLMLGSDQDILEKMAYTLSNPTLAGLVHSPEEWPGVITRFIDERRTVSIPDDLDDIEDDMPESLELCFSRPPVLLQLSDAEVARQLNDLVSGYVRKARAELESEGRKFRGREFVLRQSVESMPDTAPTSRPFVPRIVAKNQLIRKSMQAQFRHFVAAYRAARDLWRRGARDVIFPAGTYALRIFAGVRCVPTVPS